MKNLKIQKAPFVEDDLLMDICNGKRNFSLVQQFIKHAYIPVGGMAATGLALSHQPDITPTTLVASLALSAVGALAIEGYVVYTNKKEYHEQLRKSLTNIQQLINQLKANGINTNVPLMLDACLLLTNTFNYQYSCNPEGAHETTDVKHIEDFVFYDNEEHPQVLRQANVLNKTGFKTTVIERNLDLLEPTDPEYQKVIARTRTKIVAR